MIKTNYHTHVSYCNHAEGNVFDYVKYAYENGFIELGMSDHGPVLKEFLPEDKYFRFGCNRDMSLDTFEKYLSEIEQAKEMYKDKLKIYSALETEYIEEQYEFYKYLRSKVDYLNLGMHYFKYNGNYYSTFGEVNYITIEGYVDVVIKALKTGLFNTLVHPDVFMFNYKSANGIREFDDIAINASRRILEACIENNVYVEMNANGIANSITFGKSNIWLYPCCEFWQLAKEYKKLKIIIGADAHKPEALNNIYVEQLCEYVKKENIQICEKMEINH